MITTLNGPKKKKHAKQARIEFRAGWASQLELGQRD
jgi:hypothetical protein